MNPYYRITMKSNFLFGFVINDRVGDQQIGVLLYFKKSLLHLILNVVNDT